MIRAIKVRDSVYKTCIRSISPLILVFIGLQSRPSADEYLIGPILNGFYVDRADGILFEPSGNLFVRYLQGAKAIYDLGWEGILNAATLQMLTSILVNYFGPVATLVQSVIFASVFLYFLYVVNSRIFQLSGERLHGGIFFTLIATLTAFTFADFNTFRVNFGFFPFMGIRFGIYAFSTWLLVLLISYFEYQLRSTTVSRRFYISVVCFAGFTTLWFIMFWYLYLFVSFCTCFWFRNDQHFRCKKLHFKAAAASFISMLLSHNLSSVLFNRTALTSTENDNLIGSLKDTVLGNYKRLFSWELWNLSFGLQLLIGVGAGIFIAFFFRLTKELVSLITLQVVFKILVALFIFPILFYVQEQLTYEAWWHRTPLIALSLISGLLIGVFVATRSGINQSFVRLPQFALITMLFVLGLPKITDSFNELTSYRSRWDSGDPFGTESPVANSELYNQINLLKLKPYKPPNWTPSTDVLAHVNISLNSKSNGEFAPLQLDELTSNALILLSDPMLETELLHELSISFLISISGEVTNAIFLRVTDSDSTKMVKLLPSRTNRISVNSALPDRINLEVANPKLAFAISDLKLDFGPKFKSIWGIND